MVLEQLDKVLTIVKDAENGERGYLLTGDVNMMAYQEQAVHDVSDPVQQLRALTADNPIQQRRLDDLAGKDNTGGLLASKLGQLQKVYDLRQTKGLTASEILINAQSGKKAEDRIGDVIQQMKSEEEQRLGTRMRDRDQTVRDAEGTILIGTFLAIIAVLIASYFDHPQHGRTAAADHRSRDANCLRRPVC